MSSDRDRAYEELHRRIVHLEIAPGEVIREAETMAVLGVGRTPLREAVQMLQRDQLVTVVPRQGVFAGTVDIADLAELYRSRAALEPVLDRPPRLFVTWELLRFPQGEPQLIHDWHK